MAHPIDRGPPPPTPARPSFDKLRTAKLSYPPPQGGGAKWRNPDRKYSGRQSGSNRRDGLRAEYQEQAEPWQIYSGVSGSMLRGYRGIVAALVGLALTGAQKPSEQSQAKAASRQAERAILAPPSPAPSPQATYRPYSERYSDACYDAKDHDAADLCAQWRAALAAEKAADEARLATIAAIIGTVLSLATVIGLIVTILQTNGALAEARRGNRLNLLFEKRSRRESRRADADQAAALAIAERNADAAIQAAKASGESNRIAQSGNRAWVWFDAIAVANFNNGTVQTPEGNLLAMKKSYHFAVSWKNVGINPAIVRSIYLYYRIIEMMDIIPDPVWMPIPGNIVLTKNESVTFMPVFLTDEEAERFRKAEIQVVIYSGVDFFDYDSPQTDVDIRESRSCSIGTHHKGTAEVDGVKKEHITFAPTGKFTKIG